MNEFRTISTMEWPSDAILQLIEAYRDHPVLWDGTHKFSKLNNRKNEAWTELAEMFGSDVLQVKRKINSLLASFRRERHKVRLREGEAGAGKKYRSTWFAYGSFSFLYNKFKQRGIQRIVNVAPNDQASEEQAQENACDDQNIVKVEHEIVNEVEEEEEEEAEADENSQDESLVEEPEESYSPRVLVRPQKTIRPKRKRPLEQQSTAIKACKLLQRFSERQRDECDAFGEYLTSKLRKMDHRTCSIVQHAINNVLFAADMGKYNNVEYGQNSMAGFACQDSQVCSTQFLHPSSSDQQLQP